jgi:hypothetical protein
MRRRLDRDPTRSKEDVMSQHGQVAGPRSAPRDSQAPGGQASPIETAARIPAAFRALAVRLHGPFAHLSAGTRHRLASACDAFAELIEAAYDARGGGNDVRSWARFLLSALFSLELTDHVLPLSAEDEAWLLAEVEADLGEARARAEARLGRLRSPVPPRPPIGPTPP